MRSSPAAFSTATNCHSCLAPVEQQQRISKQCEEDMHIFS